ncbi:hypothetical protein [Streptomyces sp. NPDC097619]|uniref:hypothetical protein n=1 Tax=Streptomyces sp. NPDC097619 TaxID=3157228 RepID=UPI0033194848
MDAEPALHQVRAAGTVAMVVDVSRVTFACSSLLHTLLAHRTHIVIAGPVPPQLARLLKLTCTTDLFTYTFTA